MAVVYTDAEIAQLIGEPKLLPSNWHTLLRLRTKRGHYEREMDIPGSEGSGFRLIVRKSQFNPLDFSVILGVRIPQSNRVFRLRRYNGKSHEHTNHIENQTFYDFHIHMATERYQNLGIRDPREDAFAEATDRYADATGALECLLADNGFELGGPQASMFLTAPEV